MIMIIINCLKFSNSKKFNNGGKKKQRKQVWERKDKGERINNDFGVNCLKENKKKFSKKNFFQ